MDKPEEILASLADAEAPLLAAELARLSHLSRAETVSLADAWAALTPERRFEVVSRLSELSEDDAQLDFESVFRERLDDTDAGVRALAVSSLWESQDAALLPVLMRLLSEDGDDAVQAAAAQALGKFARLVALGELRAAYRNHLAETLLAVFEDDTRPVTVRGRALEAVAPLDLPEVTATIQRAYQDAERQLKISALYAMGANCQTAWVETLTGELDAADPQVRYEAITALGEIGEPGAVAVLKARLTDADQEVRLAAIAALGKIGGQEARKLLRGLRASDAAISEAVAVALDEIAATDDPLHLEL